LRFEVGCNKKVFIKSLAVSFKSGISVPAYVKNFGGQAGAPLIGNFVMS